MINYMNEVVNRKVNKRIRITAIMIIMVVLGTACWFIDVCGFTSQNNAYDCQVCGKRQDTYELYLFKWRFYNNLKEIHKTKHWELFTAAGMTCSNHVWKRGFTSSSGWLGNVDGPVGNYGFHLITKEEEKIILNKLKLIKGELMKVKFLWKLRHKINCMLVNDNMMGFPENAIVILNQTFEELRDK